MSNAMLPRDAAEILRSVNDVQDPETGRSAVELGQIRDVKISGTTAELTFALTTWSAPIAAETRERLMVKLRERFPGLTAVTVHAAEETRLPEPLGQIGLRAKSVIAVGSGKGGVGKSTIAASLACGLKRSGAVVGLMDADVYGPSIPHLLGVNQRPAVEDGRICPIMADGMPVMSMGFLTPPDQAVVWRGPMLHGAITQFLRDTQWGPLDYLVIDMPPGTGDIALTLSQLLPLTGSVIVCTPQDVALLDAVKALRMFQKVNIPVLGMVENMSYFICPDNGKRYEIFGHGGAKRRAAELEVPFLGEVPINMQMRSLGDEGRISSYYDDPLVAPYLEAICHTLVSNLARQHFTAPPLPTLSVL